MDLRWYELRHDRWGYADFETGVIVALVVEEGGVYTATKYYPTTTPIALGSFISLTHAKNEVEKVFR